MEISASIGMIVSLVGLIAGAVAIFVSFLTYLGARKRAESKTIRSYEDRTTAVDLILSGDPAFLYVMGIHLKRFSAEHLGAISQLSAQVPIRVLLLNPFSFTSLKWAQRIENRPFEVTKFGYEEYINSIIRNRILDSEAELLRLKVKKINIETRYYDSLPFGFILLSDKYCLFQPYVFPETKAYYRYIDQYMFLDNRTKLYVRILEYFNSIWQSSIDVSKNPKKIAKKEIADIKRLQGE